MKKVIIGLSLLCGTMSAMDVGPRRRYRPLRAQTQQQVINDYALAFSLVEQELAAILNDDQPVLDQVARDEAFARQLQRELYGENDDQMSQDEAYALQLQRELNGNEPEVQTNVQEAEVVQCPICFEEDTDMHAPCCIAKIHAVCWARSLVSTGNKCPVCRTVQRD